MICWRCPRPTGSRMPWWHSRRSWPRSDSNSNRPKRGTCTSRREARESTSSAFTVAGDAAVSPGYAHRIPRARPLGRRCSTPATECASSRHGTGCAHRSGDSSGPQRFLRGWAGYFRYGNSTVQFDTIIRHAERRLQLWIAASHQQPWRYGRQQFAARWYRYGLIGLDGTMAAPRPDRSWRQGANAGGEEHR